MTNPSAEQSHASGGCLTAGLFLGLTVWVAVVTAVGQTLTWALEQQLFEGSLPLPDLRWLINTIYALAVLIPAGVGWLVLRRTGRNHLQQRYFLAVALAALFALLAVPARLAGLTAQLRAMAFLAAGAGLFNLALWIIHRRAARFLSQPSADGDYEAVEPDRGRFGLAVAVGLLVGIPWVLWGALGSVEDTLLALLVSLLFGLAAAQIADLIRAGNPTPNRPADGFGLALALLVMCAGLGVNGSQGLLGLSIPVLGWAAVCVLHLAEGNRAYLHRLLAPTLLLGLAIFWPLAFIDPDELAAVITLSPGELTQWANQAAAVAAAIGLVLGLILLAARRLDRLTRRAGWGLAVVALVLVIGLYAGLGRPGLYGERLFVILKDQANVNLIAQAAKQAYPNDPVARRGAVYAALVKQAETTQAPLRQALNRWRIGYQPYYLENAIEVQGGPLVRWWLAGRPEVDRVLSSPILRPLPAALPTSRGEESTPPSRPQWNLTSIGADRVWRELGVNGQGIIIGQSDSGVDGAHPELSAAYLGASGDNRYHWYDPWNGTTTPTDFGGHGTHTLATIVGKHVGVAPGARWIGCVNLARNLGNPAFYLDCMQFNFAPFPPGGDPLRDGRPDLGANILNNSWGCPPLEGCDANALRPAVDALEAAGVFVVASAGNEGMGGCSTVKDPIAIYPDVYSVGAINQAGELTDFSSVGPVTVDGSGRVKPDIVAPGEDVLSAFPGSTYSTLSGTSMAGPHVAGVVALMWSANPKLIGDVARTRQIIDQTASPYTGPLPGCLQSGQPNNGVGYGVVNAYQAVQAAKAAE